MTGVKTARELRQRVAARFGKNSGATSFPEYVVLFEVPIMGRNRDGSPVTEDTPNYLRSRQRFDVVAVGIWGKTKNLVHGFELKVTRADLLHELRDLTKSQHTAAAVDRFWLVLGDKSIMRDTDPIPPEWGILIASGRGLRKLRQPLPQPGVFDRSLVMGLVTRALVSPTIGREVRFRDGLIRGERHARDLMDSTRRRADDQRRYAENSTWLAAATLAEHFGQNELAEQLRKQAHK